MCPAQKCHKDPEKHISVTLIEFLLRVLPASSVLQNHIVTVVRCCRLNFAKSHCGATPCHFYAFVLQNGALATLILQNHIASCDFAHHIALQ